MSQHLFSPAVIIQGWGGVGGGGVQLRVEHGWGTALIWWNGKTAAIISHRSRPHSSKVNLTQSNVPSKIKSQSVYSLDAEQIWPTPSDYTRLTHCYKAQATLEDRGAAQWMQHTSHSCSKVKEYAVVSLYSFISTISAEMDHGISLMLKFHCTHRDPVRQWPILYKPTEPGGQTEQCHTDILWKHWYYRRS